MLQPSHVWRAFTWLVAISFLNRAYAQVVRGDGSQCGCGFRDPSNGNIFTDAVIYMFNETSELGDWDVLDFENLRERGWNSIYRQGASTENLVHNANESLSFYLDPATPKHLVKGASIRSKRRDIRFGTFRASLKPPSRDNGGSALSMLLQYNDTQSMEVMLATPQNTSNAWAGTFINGEFPDEKLYGTNFTYIDENAREIGIQSAWNYTEYKLDWSASSVNFTIGTNTTRRVWAKKRVDLPQEPMPVTIKHWSTGNNYSMGGPPEKRNVAGIAWVRLFFNSSDVAVSAAFDTKCPLLSSTTCSVDDITLRGSSSYTTSATQEVEKASTPPPRTRRPAVIVLSICMIISTALLIRALFIWEPWRKQAKLDDASQSSQDHHAEDDNSVSAERLPKDEHGSAGIASSRASTYTANSLGGITVTREIHSSRSTILHELLHNRVPSGVNSAATSIRHSDLTSSRMYSNYETVDIIQAHSSDSTRINTRAPSPSNNSDKRDTRTSLQPIKDDVAAEALVVPAENNPTSSNAPVPHTSAPVLDAKRKRVDYLAGLVALCAIVVTVMHFCLSFVPAVVMPRANLAHHRSELWIQRIIAPIVLNQMWLGVFFTTSSRFLCDRYLRDGNLRHIAGLATRRIPRFMIPVTAVVIIEYFLIDAGVTYYLQYIPSITWSQWPYVARFPSFGIFVSELLELVYLQPGVIPQITFHYCTGVLWTIAVQLQHTWTILLGAVIVREIKTTWKRMCFYAFVVATGWYAESWGSFFFIGIFLTDLDVTYNWRKWLATHRVAHYLLVSSCCLFGVAALASNVVSNYTNFNLETTVRGIRPDMETGLPIGQTSRAGYPEYFVPHTNGLIFAVSIQIIVEVSASVQWVLSAKFLQHVFPHIFTFYLFHGMVFWSWGSWILCVLTDRHWSYSAALTVTGLTSYVLIVASLFVLTPVCEILGRDFTAWWWKLATTVQPPKRNTLYPFKEALFKGGKIEKEEDLSSLTSSPAGSLSLERANIEVIDIKKRP